MKRRGFLAFLGGAAVAGPGMAKQAVTAGLADLSLNGVGILGSGPMGADASTAPSEYLDDGPRGWALRRLTTMGLRTAAQHAFHKRRMSVHALDPDLAVNRSFALHHKIRLQQERNYWREIESERGYLEATIAGWFD